MEVSSNGHWYKLAKALLEVQLKTIYDASDKEMPDRYHRYCEMITELDKLKTWKKMCSTSSSRSSQF